MCIFCRKQIAHLWKSVADHIDYGITNIKYHQIGKSKKHFNLVANYNHLFMQMLRKFGSSNYWLFQDQQIWHYHQLIRANLYECLSEIINVLFTVSSSHKVENRKEWFWKRRFQHFNISLLELSKQYHDELMTSSGKAEGVCLRVLIADWKSSQWFFWISAEIVD